MSKKTVVEAPVLSLNQRAEVFDKTINVVATSFFDPVFGGRDWPRMARERRTGILTMTEPHEFEASINKLVRELGTSHTSFSHTSRREFPSTLAIGAIFVRVKTGNESRWAARKVFQGGPAKSAGMTEGDLLVAVDGREIVPPERPLFSRDVPVTITVLRTGNLHSVEIRHPAVFDHRHPAGILDFITWSRAGGVGYINASILPGFIGTAATKKLNRAFTDLADCRQLVLDLRGHLGGGLAVLRFISHLTPDRLPIGYTLSRMGAERGYDKTNLRKLSWIPSNKLFALSMLAIRFAGHDESVALFTEGLGPKNFHGRIVILADEDTVSAGEMICAFARERGLAKIVGRPTAGELIPGSTSNVGHGYRLCYPKNNYLTWFDRVLESCGIAPDVDVAWSPEASKEGCDTQLEKARELLRTM